MFSLPFLKPPPAFVRDSHRESLQSARQFTFPQSGPQLWFFIRTADGNRTSWDTRPESKLSIVGQLTGLGSDHPLLGTLQHYYYLQQLQRLEPYLWLNEFIIISIYCCQAIAGFHCTWSDLWRALNCWIQQIIFWTPASHVLKPPQYWFTLWVIPFGSIIIFSFNEGPLLPSMEDPSPWLANIKKYSLSQLQGNSNTGSYFLHRNVFSCPLSFLPWKKKKPRCSFFDLLKTIGLDGLESDLSILPFVLLAHPWICSSSFVTPY